MALGQLDISLVLPWILDQTKSLKVSGDLLIGLDFGWFQDKRLFGILRDNGFGYHLAGKGLVLPAKYWIWMLDLKTGSNGIGKKEVD